MIGNSGMRVWWNSNVTTDNGYMLTSNQFTTLPVVGLPPSQSLNLQESMTMSVVNNVNNYYPTNTSRYVGTNYITSEQKTIFLIVYGEGQPYYWTSKAMMDSSKAGDIRWNHGICYNNIFYFRNGEVLTSSTKYFQFVKKVSPKTQGDVWCGF